MHFLGEKLLPRDFPGARLRRLRPGDLEAFQAYRSIPELGRYQGWLPMDDGDALKFLTAMNEAPLFVPGDWIQLGIAQGDSDQLIGDIGIRLFEDGCAGEIGFTLEPGSQGRGLATAAVKEALAVMFASTEVEHVLGVTDSRNHASIRLLKRLGFQRHDSREIVFRGEPCSEEIYVLRSRRVRGVNRMQIAGSNCRVCDRKIIFSIDGQYCPHCENYTHVACQPQKSCSICSQPWKRLEPIQVQPETVEPRTRGITAETAIALFLVFLAAVICIGYFVFTYAIAHGH